MDKRDQSSWEAFFTPVRKQTPSFSCKSKSLDIFPISTRDAQGSAAVGGSQRDAGLEQLGTARDREGADGL